MVHHSTQTHNNVESILVQTDRIDLSEELKQEHAKQLAILKMSNSVMCQEIQQVQQKHESAIRGLNNQMELENE